MSETNRRKTEPGPDRRDQTDRRSLPDRRAHDRYTPLGSARAERRQGERRAHLTER